MGEDFSFQKYIPLLNLINEAIVIYNSEKIQWVNEAFVNLLGYTSPYELIGKNIVYTIHPESRQEGTHQVNRLYSGVEKTGGVYMAIKKDGSFIPVVSRGSRIQNHTEITLISFVRSLADDPVNPDLYLSGSLIKNEISTSITLIRGYLDLFKEMKQEEHDLDTEKIVHIINENLQRIEDTLTHFNFQ